MPGKPFKKGKSGNPGGRPKKTEDERAGEEYLRNSTEAAAKRLVKLQSSEDEKIALGATVAHLKITLGTLERRESDTAESMLTELVDRVKGLPAKQREQIEAELERAARG